MKAVTDWFERQAVRERRGLVLEDALLGDRFAAYVGYRLRFWLARYAVASAVQVIQVLVLHRLFPREGFLTLIGLIAVAAMATAAWWGALEVLRERVRELHRSGAPHRVPAEISRWLSGSIWIGVLCLAVAVAWFGARALAAPAGIEPVEAAAAAILVRIGIDIPRRCFHSGIYALRRVYRPLPSILALEVVGVGSLVLLVPPLGVWAVPVAELVSIAVVSAISIVFTARAYRSAGFDLDRHLRLRPPRFRTAVRRLAARRSASLGPPRAFPELGATLPPAIAAAAMGVDSLLVPAVFGAVGESGDGWITAVLIAAVAPSMRAGFDWSQLLYFDLMRLDRPPLADLRRRFLAAAARLAPFLAVAFWAVSGAIGTFVLGYFPTGIQLLLLPFFLASAWLALGQMEAFTRGEYGRCALGGAVLGAGLLALGPLAAGGLSAIVGLGLVAGVAVLSLLVAGRLGLDRSGAGARPLTWVEWLSALAREPGPVAVMTARFGPPAAAWTAEEQHTAEWRARTIARAIARRLGQRGSVSVARLDALTWFERVTPAQGRRVDRSWLLRVTGARLREYREAETGRGREAARLAATWRVGRDTAIDEHESNPAAAPVASDARAPRIETIEAALVERFSGLFSDGIVYETGRPAPATLRRRTARERRAILAAVIRSIEGLPPRGSDLPFEVTAWSPAGQLRTIFAVPRASSRRADRARWRAVLRTAHLQLAIGEVGPDPFLVDPEADMAPSGPAL